MNPRIPREARSDRGTVGSRWVLPPSRRERMELPEEPYGLLSPQFTNEGDVLTEKEWDLSNAFE